MGTKLWFWALNIWFRSRARFVFTLLKDLRPTKLLTLCFSSYWEESREPVVLRDRILYILFKFNWVYNPLNFLWVLFLILSFKIVCLQSELQTGFGANLGHKAHPKAESSLRSRSSVGQSIVLITRGSRVQASPWPLFYFSIFARPFTRIENVNFLIF